MQIQRKTNGEYDSVQIRRGVYPTVMAKIDGTWTPFRAKDLKDPAHLAELGRATEAFVSLELAQSEWGSLKKGIEAGVYQIAGVAGNSDALDAAFGE